METKQWKVKSVEYETPVVKPTGTRPDFKGDGVAVWINQIKEGEHKGEDYLSIQLLGKNGIKINAFKYEPKQE